MQLEDYFDFDPDPAESIRIKGTRIGLEHVVGLYKGGMFPEQIAVYFGCPITVEQAYAAVTYYLHNKDEVEAYMERGRAATEAARREWQAAKPSAAVERLRAMKAARAAAGPPS